MEITKEILIEELIINKISIPKLAKKLDTKPHIIRRKINNFGLSEEFTKAFKSTRDIVGRRYGRLLVISFNGTDAWNKSEWKCQCDCGNIVIVSISGLTQKHTTSCGCLRKESNKQKFWKGHGEISGDAFSSIRRNAESRAISFNITIEDIWNLFLKQNRKCALTGETIYLVSSKRIGARATASLDRIDNSKGYELENVQWVHKHVNIAKHTYSNEEFIKMCNKVAKLHPRST